MSEQLQPHDCTGTLPVCTTCFKKRTDPIHTVMPLGIHTVNASDPGIETSNIVPDIATFNAIDADISTFSIMQPATNDDPEPLPPFEEPFDNLMKVQLDQAALNGIVRHDPTCKCPDCCSQMAADNQRTRHILQEKGRYLTGAESVQAAMRHEEFVLVNLIKDKDGNEYPDWLDRVEAHIMDLRRKIELFRVQEATVFKVRAQKQTDDMKAMAEKLTPEELEAYKKDAAKKARSPRISTPKPEKSKDYSKELNALLKKRDAAFDALKAMGIPESVILTNLAPTEKAIAELKAKMDATKAAEQVKATEVKAAEPTERKSKRERAIESLMKAGLSREAAERMVPNA